MTSKHLGAVFVTRTLIATTGASHGRLVAEAATGAAATPSDRWLDRMDGRHGVNDPSTGRPASRRR